MRIVRSLSDALPSFTSCQREALTAFGRSEVFLEEFWENTKHLEVQILADGQGGVVHLYERDCTVQHRHQKVIELAPAREIHPELRERLVNCAVTLARQCNYKGAGTVEFLVRGELTNPDTEFVFMEVNPRVQVEHTVTEEATGVDIVQAQLLIAGGRTLEDLGLTQDNIRLRQHSLQARITIMPGKGEILDFYQEPVGLGVRCDTAGWYTAFKPNQMYDPLVGKLICSAEGVTTDAFEEARIKTMKSLDDFKIEGIANNIDAVKRILTHEEFLANQVNTSFLADNPEILDPSKAPKKQNPEHGSAKRVYSEEKIRFELTPPMTGNILEVRKKVGDEVDVGEAVVVLSAMKIETEMVSPVKGIVTEINCSAGEQVSGDQVVAVLEGHEEIKIEATDVGSASNRAHSSSAGMQLSDPTMDVWRGSDNFVPQYNVNDGFLAVQTLPSLSDAQLQDAKAQERKKRNQSLKDELTSKLTSVKLGGGENAVAKHRERGKMLPRERIAKIIDPGSAFLEIGTLAGGDGLYKTDDGKSIDLPSGGVVAGIGLVHGREVMIVANDATVKGGTYFPITVSISCF
jgi:acetyl/propionyl-CoA carboxylase alpha subunit